MAFSFLMSLTEEQFKDYLKTSVKEALTENNNKPVNSPELSDDFLTIKEASLYTRIPVATLYDYTHKKKIPFNKIGQKLLFTKSELAEWINAKRSKVVQGI